MIDFITLNHCMPIKNTIITKKSKGMYFALFNNVGTAFMTFKYYLCQFLKHVYLNEPNTMDTSIKLKR